MGDGSARRMLLLIQSTDENVFCGPTSDPEPKRIRSEITIPVDVLSRDTHMSSHVSVPKMSDPQSQRAAVYASPERYVQGPGVMAELGHHMDVVGMEGPVLVLSSPSVKTMLEGTWKETLEKAGYRDHIIITFARECTTKVIHGLVEEAKRHGCRTIVAVGGGKTIDTGKVVASKTGMSMVSCPTIASTDAPCSALAVVYTDEGEFQEYVFPKRHPSLVLVDTSVICKAPARLLIGGLGDALATWFEARTVREAHSQNFLGGVPTLTGTALAELCYKTLLQDGAAAVRSVEAQVVTPALERIVEANTLLSGLGFECGGLCTAHAVHNGLTVVNGTHGYTHGEKVSFGLCTQLWMEGRPSSEIETVLTWQHAIGLPITLAEVGLDAGDEDAIRAIAHRTVQEGETVHNSPFPVTARMIEDNIKAANHIGERFKEKHSIV